MSLLGSTHRRGQVPLPLLVLAAPVVGLVFLVTLPLAGLAAIAWGLGRPPAGTEARPAGDLATGHREPRSPRPAG